MNKQALIDSLVASESDMIKETLRLCMRKEREGSNVQMNKLMEEVAEELGCTVVEIKIAMLSQSMLPIIARLGL